MQLFSILCIFFLYKLSDIEGKTCATPRKMYKCIEQTAYLVAHRKITKGTPYSWFRVYEHHKPIKADFRPDSTYPANDITNKTLAIRKLSTSDSGHYAYRPSKSAKVNCSDYELIVYNKDLIAIPDEVDTVEGGHVELKVQAFHVGEAMWYIGNKFLMPANAHHYTPSSHFKYISSRTYGLKYGSVLEIRNIKKRHAGVYTLKWQMSGVCGQSQVSINVKVKALKDMDGYKEGATDKDESTRTIDLFDTTDLAKTINKIDGNDGHNKIYKRTVPFYKSFLITFAGVLFLVMLSGTYVYVMCFRKKKKKPPEQDIYGALFAEDFKNGKNGTIKYQPLSTIDEDGARNAKIQQTYQAPNSSQPPPAHQNPFE